MTITLTWGDVSPFLAPRVAAQRTRVDPWLKAMQIVLNARYGDRITTEPDGGNVAAFYAVAADAAERRFNRPGMVLQQAVGPASVRFDARATLARWFLPEEIDQLDEITGVGSITSKRTPAPDGVRFGNLAGGIPRPVERW